MSKLHFIMSIYLLRTSNIVVFKSSSLQFIVNYKNNLAIATYTSIVGYMGMKVGCHDSQLLCTSNKETRVHVCTRIFIR